MFKFFRNIKAKISKNQQYTFRKTIDKMQIEDQRMVIHYALEKLQNDAPTLDSTERLIQYFKDLNFPPEDDGDDDE